MIKICESYEYDKFKILTRNRGRIPRNLERIKESMKSCYLVSPMCVNSNWYKIDGNHRFTAAKELGFPIRYYMCKAYGLKEIQILNANQKNWTNVEYLDSFCELAYPEYLKIRNFIRKWKGIGLANAIIIISEGATTQPEIKFKGNAKKGTSVSKNMFRSGKYECGNMDVAEDVVKKLFNLRGYLDFYKKRSFVLAFKKVYLNSNFEYQVFLNKLTKYPSKIKDCPNTDHFLTMIEELYNYRNRNKVSLRY